MAIAAYFEPFSESVDSEIRLRLRFGQPKMANQIEGLVHSISANSILIEADAAFDHGDEIDVRLPHSGSRAARVTWISRHLFGCQFHIPLSDATLGAAVLKGAVGRDILPSMAGKEPAIESFGARMRRLRVEKGLTQADIASALGVSEPSVSAWESDRSRPKAGRVDALASLLRISKTQLLGYHHNSDSLQELVARCRNQIADAVGTEPEKVRISVEM